MNNEGPDKLVHYAVSDLGLHHLPMSHKKDARLIWVNVHAPIAYSLYWRILCILCICTVCTVSS